MKKSLFILALFASIISCSNEDSLLGTISDDEQVPYQNDVINRRSFEEVVQIAENSISMIENNETKTRSHASNRTIDLANGVKAMCKTKTRANGEGTANDTLLYILNFKDNQGFAVVSACRQTDGLIAVIESGHYDPSTPTGNSGFDNFMTMAYNLVSLESQKSIIKESTRSGNPIMCKPVYDTIFNKKVEPKINVRWGQKQRMGQFCRNGIAGCSNTAVAQIMSYFKHPKTLTLTYPNRDTNTTALDWTSICKHIDTSVGYNRDDADLQIGRLARQLGQYSGSNYDEKSATSTTTKGSRSTLSKLGYTVGNIVSLTPTNGVFADDDLYEFANILSQNKLIFMRGEHKGNDGHAWVIDGCYYVKALYRLMATYDGTTWSVFQEMGTYKTCHNHINWGWDGYYNGYFNGWVYNANQAVKYDENVNHPTDSTLVFTNNFMYFTVTH